MPSIQIWTDSNGLGYIEMTIEEMQELRDEMHAWDGLIELGPVPAELLKQLTALLIAKETA